MKLKWVFVILLIINPGCLGEDTPTETQRDELDLELANPKEKSVEIKTELVFPNGTIKKNETYYLGEFSQNYTFKVESRDAMVYLNDLKVEVYGGEFIISVPLGGEYLLRVNEKEYDLLIGHGEVYADHVNLEEIKIFYEDGTVAKNRTITVYDQWDHMGNWSSSELISNETGIIQSFCYHLTGGHIITFEFLDKETGKQLLECDTRIDTAMG